MAKVKYLHLNTRDEYYRVEFSKLVYFEADGNYTRFVVTNKLKGELLMNLSQVQDMLDENLKEQAAIFERVGRHFIINLNYVYHIEVNRQKLTLSDGATFEYKMSVSKDALRKLREKTHSTAFHRLADTNEEEPTQGALSSNLALGRLVVVGSDMPFQLQEGENIIGRKAAGSTAHVQIPCDNKRVSREHLIVEITSEGTKGLVHYVSLSKQEVNPTYVGEVLLKYGKKVALKHNDIIKLPDIELRFELPEEDRTELIVR